MVNIFDGLKLVVILLFVLELGDNGLEGASRGGMGLLSELTCFIMALMVNSCFLVIDIAWLKVDGLKANTTPLISSFNPP